MWVAKLLPTPVYVHIATEVPETFHPGVSGLCWSGVYILKVWLKTLVSMEFPQSGD